MRLLYIAVHEQNQDWGAEFFLAKAFLSLGVDLVTIDYRKHRKDIIQQIKQVGDFDYFFLQRGDDFPIGILKSINRPKFFWASELISRNRDQDRLLKSGLFEHVFVHTLACKRSIIEEGWLTADKVTVLLNGFDPMFHYPIRGIKKDIDVLFIGNMLGRRRKWLDEIKRSCNLCEAVGVYGADMVQLVNRAKIVLNIHSEEYLDTETRLFEVMACRSFLLSERLSEDSPFINGSHLVEVMDVKEMIFFIQIYLKSSELRQKISNEGYECVMKNHTYLKRAELLLSLFTSYYKTEQNRSVDPIRLKKAVLESFYLYKKNCLLDFYRQLRSSIRKRFIK